MTEVYIITVEDSPALYESGIAYDVFIKAERQDLIRAIRGYIANRKNGDVGELLGKLHAADETNPRVNIHGLNKYPIELRICGHCTITV